MKITTWKKVVPVVIITSSLHLRCKEIQLFVYSISDPNFVALSKGRKTPLFSGLSLTFFPLFNLEYIFDTVAGRIELNLIFTSLVSFTLHQESGFFLMLWCRLGFQNIKGNQTTLCCCLALSLYIWINCNL